MRARTLWSALVLAILLVAGRGTADATILIKKNLAQLATESERVVVAQIGAQHCDYAPNTKVIFTYTNLIVEKTLKGEASAELEIAELGGTLGDVTTIVDGMPRFTEGDRVLLFLKKDALGQWRTHGCVQGCFVVVDNIATGERLVKLDPAMAHIHRAYFATEADPRPTAVNLDEFRAVVARLAEKKEQK